MESIELEGEEVGEENKGFKILKKMGWEKGKRIGRREQGRLYPLHVDHKRDKSLDLLLAVEEA